MSHNTVKTQTIQNTLIASLNITIWRWVSSISLYLPCFGETFLHWFYNSFQPFCDTRKYILHFYPKQNAVNRTTNSNSTFKDKNIFITSKYTIAFQAIISCTNWICGRKFFFQSKLLYLRLFWLKRLTEKWQFRLTSLSSSVVWVLFCLRVHFSSLTNLLLSSSLLRPLLMFSMLMFGHFMSLLLTYLFLMLEASSPYAISFGILPSDTRCNIRACCIFNHTKFLFWMKSDNTSLQFSGTFLNISIVFELFLSFIWKSVCLVLQFLFILQAKLLLLFEY